MVKLHDKIVIFGGADESVIKVTNTLIVLDASMYLPLFGLMLGLTDTCLTFRLASERRSGQQERALSETVRSNGGV